MKNGDDVLINLLKTFGIPLPRQQRSLDSYHRILLAAQDCIAELGYSRTTTQEIAKRAEISQGGLFKRFPSKVSLMALMVGYIEARVRQQAVEQSPPDLLSIPVRERVRIFIEGYWLFAQTAEFKAIDEVWDESRTDGQLLDALRPVMASDVVAGDLTLFFPELENSTTIQFMSQMIYASVEYLSFNHDIGIDADAPEKLELLVDMVCREINRLREI